jgi:hypothetical protein
MLKGNHRWLTTNSLTPEEGLGHLAELFSDDPSAPQKLTNSWPQMTRQTCHMPVYLRNAISTVHFVSTYPRA